MNHEGENHEGENHEGENHEGENHEGENHEGENHEGENHEGQHHDERQHDGGEYDEAKYGQRDEAIRRLLLSPGEAEKIEGLKLLDADFRERLFKHARSHARSDTVFATLSQPDVYPEVWSRTLEAVWKNVNGGSFTEGSLFSYLIRIARRKAIDWWRNFSRTDSTASDLFAAARPEPRIELLDDIKLFITKHLKEEDQVAMRLDITLAIENNFKWESAEVYTAELNEVRRDKGWRPKTVTAIRAWRTRVRRELRTFLINRGYDV